LLTSKHNLLNTIMFNYNLCMNTWILVANASKAFLYSSENLYTGDLQLVEELRHPESREKGVDLITDGPGGYATDHGARSAYEKSRPKEDEAEIFAIKLASLLKDGNYNHDYEQLVLVVTSHFYGLMKKHMDFVVDEFVHIDKDYTQLTQRELIERLHEHIFANIS